MDINTYINSSNFNQNPFQQENVNKLNGLGDDIKAAVNENEEQINRFLSGDYVIKGKDKILFEADEIKTLAPEQWISSGILDLFLQSISATASTEKIYIFPVNFLPKLLELEEDERNEMLKRFEKKYQGDLFCFEQLHFPLLGGCHFNLISINRVFNDTKEEFFLMTPKCSLGRNLDDEVIELLKIFKNFYEYKNQTKAFKHEQWHSPGGRGVGRAPQQTNNGNNCGAYVGFNIEMNVVKGIMYTKFNNADANTYRKYMALKIMGFVNQSEGFSLVEKERPSKRKRVVRLMPRSKGSDFIDLTEDSD